MKKYLLFVLLMICPMFVYADEDIEYHVCKSGCEFTELDAVFGAVNELTGGYDKNIIIHIDDDGTYDLSDNNYIYNIYGWVDSEYRSRITNFTIEGTNGQPKITSSGMHQDFNNTERSIFIEAWEDIVIKNVKIEVPNSILFGTRGSVKFDKVDMKAEGFFSYYTAKDNVVSDLKMTGDLMLSSDSKVTSSTINGVLGVDGRLTADNVNVYGFIASKGTVDIKNSTIDADKKEYGILFNYNDCLGDCSSSMRVDKDSVIKNTIIKNATKSAIMYNRSHPHQKRQLLIDNTDMGSNPTSIIMYNIYSWGPNDFYDGYSVVVTNSKVAGAETYRALHENWNDEANKPDLKDTKALNMYFDASNTWVKPLNRVNDPSKKNNKKANIVETNKGKIVVERKNSISLVLNAVNGISLEQIFEELGEVLGEVYIADPSIVKLENNKLIPLKSGETDVTFMVDNTSYVLHVKVDKAEENPKTVDAVIIAIVLLVISIGIYVISINKKKALD